jgi:hypothetical protein
VVGLEPEHPTAGDVTVQDPLEELLPRPHPRSVRFA